MRKTQVRDFERFFRDPERQNGAQKAVKPKKANPGALLVILRTKY